MPVLRVSRPGRSGGACQQAVEAACPAAGRLHQQFTDAVSAIGYLSEAAGLPGTGHSCASAYRGFILGNRPAMWCISSSNAASQRSGLRCARRPPQDHYQPHTPGCPTGGRPAPGTVQRARSRSPAGVLYGAANECGGRSWTCPVAGGRCGARQRSVWVSAKPPRRHQRHVAYGIGKDKVRDW